LYALCTTVSAAVLRRATSISCGWFRSELLDLAGERRREQQVLPLGGHGHQRHDALDVRDEAHVEHAVGFVEHEDLDLAQVDALLLDVVEEPAGRRDEDLDAGAHDRELLLDVDAAEHAGRPDARVLAVGLDRLLDLDRQLARRREDQRADRVAGRREACVRVALQALEDREDEGRGLAGARLGGTEHVVAGDDDRDGLLLDGRGFGVALVHDGAEEFGREAEIGEGQG
jgi:hypothetical protein